MRALRYLAAEEHRSVAQLIRQAADQYLVREFQDWKDWGGRFDVQTQSPRRRRKAPNSGVVNATWPRAGR